MHSRDQNFAGYTFDAVATTHALLIGLVKLAGVGIKACRHAAHID